MARKERNGSSLTDSDTSIAKGMLARGGRQHDMAAWFGVNGGPIGNISTAAKFPRSVKNSDSSYLFPLPLRTH
jgi:hypothetical protein